MFVSATISAEIERLARQYMHGPVEKLIAPGADDRPTVESVEQYYLSAQPWDKYRLLRMLLIQENPELAIVFCRTKRGAEKIASCRILLNQQHLQQPLLVVWLSRQVNTARHSPPWAAHQRPGAGIQLFHPARACIAAQNVAISPEIVAETKMTL